MSIFKPVTVVTGASVGIGEALARVFARNGHEVALVARREKEMVLLSNELAVTCKHKPHVIVADLLRTDAPARIAHELLGRGLEPAFVINNAGFGFFGTVEKTPHVVVREIFALNFEAPLFASQLVIPMMRAQKSGHIINVGSVAGKRGLPLSGIYCATKFALDGLTQAMRLEVEDAGIDVTLVNPAATLTEFSDHLRHGDVVGEFRSLGRVQSAQIVAAAIVRAIRNPTAEVYPYGFSRGLVWINAAVPSLTDRLVKRALKDRIRAAKAST